MVYFASVMWTCAFIIDSVIFISCILDSAFFFLYIVFNATEQPLESTSVSLTSSPSPLEGWTTTTSRGTRSASSASAARTSWPASASPPGTTSPTALTASATCLPRNVPPAPAPSAVKSHLQLCPMWHPVPLSYCLFGLVMYCHFVNRILSRKH